MPFKKKRYYRKEISSLDIPGKANRILNILLFSIIIILLRVWYLAVIQYDVKVEESKKPLKKTVMEPAKRGTIRDRFNAPLAINKIQFQAAVIYSEFLQIPSVTWEKNENGIRVKHFKRKEYIASLSKLLGKELGLDALRIEDLIYSKASFYHQFPFILKEEIDESCYCKLKMLEKDWPGIHMQRVPKRHYPKNQTAADIIGYMGSINRQEYEKIMQEMMRLSHYLKEYETGDIAELPEGITSHEDAVNRLKELEANAYTINDYVGKAGVEGFFEEHLRGYQGRKSFYSDSRGNFLRELPGGRKSLSGDRLLLTISAELQEFAEELLAKNEAIRLALVSNKSKEFSLSLRQPWIKGGAIVVMDPNTGEIIALASYPRFNPNDFIASRGAHLNKEKQSNINRWFETETHIAEIWDQKRAFERERFDIQKKIFVEEKLTMNFKSYLDFILPKTSDVYREITKSNTIADAIFLQQEIEKLILLSGQKSLAIALNAAYKEDGHIALKLWNNETKEIADESFKENEEQLIEIKQKLLPHLSHIKQNYDKLLLTDLYRTLVPAHLFSKKLLQEIGSLDIAAYRDISAAMITISDVSFEMTKDFFHKTAFLAWRKEFEKSFLKEKRQEEKLLKKHQRPYIEYFDAKEKEMFTKFWQENRLTLILAFLTGRNKKTVDPELKTYLDHFKNLYITLKTDPDFKTEWKKAYETLKNGISPLKIQSVLGFLSTLRRFHDLNQELYGSYRHLKKNRDGKQLEKHLASAFYPKQGFGYGRSQGFRQSATQGSIFKLLTAYETLVQRYQKLDKKNLTFKDLNPLEIVDATHRQGKEISVGFFHDGTPIPRMYKGGRLLKSSRSGIGRIDLIKAIETSSNPYFSLLAADILDSPDDLTSSARLFSFGRKTGIDLMAEHAGKLPEDLSYNKTGLYALANGQHSLVVTPLQTAVFLSSIANGGKVLKPIIVKYRINNDLKTSKNRVIHSNPKIQKVVFMPEIIRGMLLEGMRLVVQKQAKTNLTNLSRLYKNDSHAIKNYIDLKEQFAGKTSTSESLENISLSLTSGTNLYTHTWFGGISFKTDMLGLSKDTILFKDGEGRPELVVVVYFKYGSFGWEAAPVAAQMVKKWREIKEKHSVN